MTQSMLDSTAITEDVKTEAHRRHAATVVIQPSHGWSALGLREMWHYRELLYFMIWRDIKVRYKQVGS